MPAQRSIVVLAVAAVQGATLLALVVVDYRRKKLRKPATFPRLPPGSVTVGGSEVTVYTYGEDLYRDMLNAIGQAKSRIFFESFIWKSDAVGQALTAIKMEMGVALRGVEADARARTALEQARAIAESTLQSVRDLDVETLRIE